MNADEVRADQTGSNEPEGAFDGKYGIITAEKKKFHPGEPLFLIRATDPDAVRAIQAYRNLCLARGCSAEHVKEIRAHGELIRKWQQENPHLVKEKAD